MRILFVAGSFNQGGAEFQILSLANLMQSQGNEVFILALTEYDFYKPYLADNKLRYRCLSNQSSKFKRVLQLSRFINEYKPNAIICFLKIPSLSTIFAKMLSMHNAKLLLGERTALINPVHDFFHFIFWHYADVVTTNSVSKYDYFKRNFPLLRKKLHLVRNVYPIYLFQPPTQGNYLFDNKFLNIIFVGRLSPEKNVHKLLETFSIIPFRTLRARLYLIGDTRNKSYKDKLDGIVLTSSLEDFVFFIPPVSQDKLKVLYANADFICLLSEYEGFSNVLAESMMQGCIPIVSNIPENTIVVTNEENGFIVDLKKESSLKEQLTIALNTSVEKRLRMKNLNKKIISKFLKPQGVYSHYLELLS